MGFYIWYLVGVGKRIYYEYGGGDMGVSIIIFMDFWWKNVIIIFCNINFLVNKFWCEIVGMVFR